jgi:hypothetical protein
MSSTNRKRAAKGVAAEQLVKEPVLLEALEFLRDEALGKFKSAANPTASWEAKLEYDALENFASQLLMYIRSGKDAVAAMRREQEAAKVPSGDLDGASVWLTEASKARAEFDAAQQSATNLKD